MLVKSCHLHHERVVGGRAGHRTIGTHHHGRAKRPTIGAAGRAELCLQVAHPPLQLSHLNTLSVIVCVSTNLGAMSKITTHLLLEFWSWRLLREGA